MRFTAPLVLIAVLSLSGCQADGLGSSVATVSTQPVQIATLAQAALAADAIVRLTKVAVDTGKLDAATLTELQFLRGSVRSALDKLHADQAKGVPLAFSVFGATLDAYKAYAATKGL